MDLRVRMPGAVYRMARDKAGDDKALLAQIVRFVTDYATGATMQAKGGRARAKALSSDERSAIARAGGLARQAGREQTK